MNSFQKACLAVAAACGLVAINAAVWGMVCGF